MNLSFTKDPQWIEQRTLLWNELESELKNGLSRKEVERWREYFFTGSLPSGKSLSPFSLLTFFPQFDDEGIQYCLKNVITEKMTDDQFWSLQTLFAGNLKTVPGLALEDSLKIFKGGFGDKYEPNRTFPYRLFGEGGFRQVDLSPNLIFAYGTSTFVYIASQYEQPENVWLKLGDFFISLIPHVDPRFFNIQEDKDRVQIDGATLRKVQGRLNKLMRMCFELPDTAKTKPQTELIVNYLEGLKKDLNKLDDYPGQLKSLWEGIKAEYAA